MRAWLCAVLAVSACGGGGTGTGDDDQPDAAVDAPPDVGPTWTTLIELKNWSLPTPSSEDFQCVRIKVPTEMYIGGFRVSSPPGTHHEILTVSPATAPVGPYPCDGSNLDTQMLFAGGIGTNPLEFPTGVAIKLPANTIINLNLHLVNYSDAPLAGTSGIQVLQVAASDVVHEADMMFLGKGTLMIPPGTKTEIATCSIPAQWTILNLWPHMHQYGQHQRVKRLKNNNQMQMLLDTDYSYMDQKTYPMTIPLEVNEQLTIECVYNNTSGGMLLEGDGVNNEMCRAGFYKYPAGGNKDLCVL
jgi:hypothetical protein